MPLFTHVERLRKGLPEGVLADDDPGTRVAGSPGTSARSASGTPTVGVAATDLAERMGAAATGC